MLRLLDDVKSGFPTLGEAIDHVAAQAGRSPAAVRVAPYSSRTEGPQQHATSPLSAEQDSTLVAVAQAFSANNIPLSIGHMQELVERKWGVKVSRMWVPRVMKRHRNELSQRG